MRRIYNIIIITAFIICALFCGPGFAKGIDDGFQEAKRVESRYFSISIEDGVDSEKLSVKLSVPLSIKAIIKEPISDVFSLPNQLDTLFLAASEIMDIHLKKFKCDVKICKDASSLSTVAYKLFGQEIQPGGFYVLALDTVYIDAKNININMLGHEFSHAIQTHYFVVPPPEKIQEVLAAYVEYELRKYTLSLPE
ncbi:hypothetical protein OAA99_01110 [Omnitrophica bacterium]|nr:hypothetical protein [Candidatus Omnitrophota bacterium]